MTLRDVLGVHSLRSAVSAWGLSVVAETAALVVLLVVANDIGGPALVAGFAVVRSLPALVVAPVVIGWSDRGRRERWLLAVLGGRSALLFLAAALLTAGASLAGLLAGGLASLLFSTHRPMSSALLPHLATSPSQLTGANAASSFAESAGMLVGPLMAGALLLLGPPSLTLFLAAGLVGLAALAVGRIRDVAASNRPGSVLTLRSAVGELGSGMAALVRQRPLVALVAGQTFARGVLLVCVVVLAVDVFDHGDPGVGWLSAMLGIGGLAGSVTAAALVTSTRLSRAVPTGVALWGLPMVAIGALTVPTMGYLGFVVIGIGNAVLDVGAFTLVARLIPPGMLGRAFAALEVIIVLSVTAGSLAAGVAVPALGVSAPLLVTGAVIALVAVGCVPWARRLDAGLVPGEHVATLRSCRELEALSVAAVDHLAAVGSERSFADGVDVLVQGEAGDEFHVIVAGHARITRDGEVVAELGPGSGFGEIALLRNVPRTATATAAGELRTFVVTRPDFTTFVAGHPAAAAAVASVAQERSRDNERRRAH